MTPPPERRPGLRILSLTRLAPEKNLETTLDVFARVHRLRPEARLTMAGEGPQTDSLRSLACDLGIDQTVTFPGFVDAPKALCQHDVLLQPSKADNLSYTLLDAVNHGLGVVASPVGGNSEILPPRCIFGLQEFDGMANAAIAQGLETKQRPTLVDRIPNTAEMARQIATIYASHARPLAEAALPHGGAR